jgi:hypothetical protein
MKSSLVRLLTVTADLSAFWSTGFTGSEADNCKPIIKKKNERAKTLIANSLNFRKNKEVINNSM